MDDQIDLTVGGLLRSLQDIASRYGNDTPVVVPALADADYEQATTPFVRLASPDDQGGDWALFKANPAGNAVVVIS